LHTGRIGHPLLIDGRDPVAPSAVAAKVSIFTPEGPKECVTPRVLAGGEVEQTLADFVAAARNAIAAGFDGVEVHGANGYLVHQFLAPTTNLRTDGWGVSVDGRIRFALELIRGIADAIGPERTALRISPGNPYNDMSEPDPDTTYLALAEALRPLGLAYLHMIETGQDLKRWDDPRTRQKRAAILEKVRNELLSPQPAPKRVPRRVKSANEWSIGEAVGLRLQSGSWTLMRVVGHHNDKGGRSAVCELLDWVDPEIPPAETIARLPIKSETAAGGISQFLFQDPRRKQDQARVKRLGIVSTPAQKCGGYAVLVWPHVDGLLKKIFGLE
jgi:hypothetical protein